MLCLYLLGDLFPIFSQTFSMFYAVSEQMNELNAYQTSTNIEKFFDKAISFFCYSIKIRDISD